LCTVRGARTLLDANGPSLISGVTAPPTLLKVNLFELQQVVGRQAGGTTERVWAASPAEILDAARDLQARGVSMVVVSLGERGVVGLDPQGSAWSASTQLHRPVVDAVGSGDALGAGCVVALSRGMSSRRMPFADALRLGVACGAANTLVAGAGRCRLADIEGLAVHAQVTSLCGLSGLALT
jgi:fructose-1-phosphate kinase PfkB-like protein